jgi:hypothetical protein
MALPGGAPTKRTSSSSTRSVASWSRRPTTTRLRSTSTLLTNQGPGAVSWPSPLLWPTVKRLAPRWEPITSPSEFTTSPSASGSRRER